MSVLVTTVKRFIGVSTDAKPTDEVPAGSSFLESDTGTIARFDGRTWRISEAGANLQAELLAQAVTELSRIRVILGLANEIDILNEDVNQ